jgi:ubiquinol-cytochrome c reductase cytochrome c1 subunit
MRVLERAAYVIALVMALAGALGDGARAQDTTPLPPPHLRWQHDGIFGTYDRAAAQRGFQVYQQICSNCHSMNLLAYRDLQGIGFSPEQVKAIAAQVQTTAGPNDQGEMFERPGLPSDHFKKPFPNDQAARAANNGALPPDLSVITKAREGGGDYLAALLTGYREPPAGVTVASGMYYNPFFPGHQLAMPQMVQDNAVTYTDGTPATKEQIAHDVVTFLSWAAEPKLEERHQIGAKTMLFLFVFTGLMYGVKRKVWADAH